MFRTLLGAVAAILFALSPAIRAQQADEDDVWKSIFMRGLNAASANDYVKAEQIFQQALKEAERFGPDDARVGTTINTLGLVYRSEKKYGEAEAEYRHALTILEKAYGDDSIEAGNVNFNLATIMFDQGHQPSAMPFLQRALPVYEAMLGPDSLKTASVLCMIGDSFRVSKDFKGAEDPLRRCADIRESNGGMQNSELADALQSLALTYQGEGKYALAEPRFTLAEKIREKTLGITSPLLAQTMEDHAALLRQMGRDKEAARLETISTAIRRSEKKGK
jgi:tetratricopeptide (TPR) repeat protein